MTTRNGATFNDEMQKSRGQKGGAAKMDQPMPGADLGDIGAGSTVAQIAKGNLPQKDQILAIVKNVQRDVTKTLNDNPRLLPAATGAAGFAVGILVGSKLSRILLMVGIGAAVNELIKAGGLDKLRDLIEQPA